MDLVFIRSGKLGFDHDGILRPWLQREDEVPGFLLILSICGARRRVYICYDPAVRATCILTVKLSHVLIWPREAEKMSTNPYIEGITSLQWTQSTKTKKSYKMNLRVRVDGVLNTVKMKMRRKYRKYGLFNLVWTIKLAKQNIQTSLKSFQSAKCSGFWTVLIFLTAFFKTQ